MNGDNSESQDNPDSVNDEGTTIGSIISLVEELKNFKTYFNLNDFVEGLVMKFFLPANDIISDFLIAECLSKVENEKCDTVHTGAREEKPECYDEKEKHMLGHWFTFFAYYNIACPGFMFIFSIVGKQMKGFIWPFLFMFCFFCLEAILVKFSQAHLLFPLAVLVSSLTLGIGFLGIFFHGPRMTSLSYLMAGYEGRFESVPQFLMHLTLLISGERYFYDSGLNLYGICTSVLMLGKDLTENILMSERFQQKSFLDKLVEMRSIILVVMLTAIFRLGTLALALHHIFVLQTGFYLIPLKLVIIVIPVIGVFFIQNHYETTRISVPECFVGIIAELSAFYNWSTFGEDISRKLQFMLNTYYGLLYTSYCLWTAWNRTNENAGTFALVFLCSGWAAFPLFISQIFIRNIEDDDEDGREEDVIHDTFPHNEVITYI